MHLSGQLSDWSISDLLQIMQVTNKTGSLDIEGDRRGRVHFRDGRVTGAELSGASGVYAGSDRSAVADVLYVLSTMDSGTFAVGAADGPEGKGWPVEDVMSELEALRSLEGEVIDAGLFEANGVRLVGEIGAPLTIEPDDWSVLVTLVRPFSFGQLETAFGRGTAVRIFHTLHRLGMAEAASIEADETEWLDRLAEEVSPSGIEAAWLEQTDESHSTAAVPVMDSSDGSSNPEPVEPDVAEKVPSVLRGVSAPANTTLTDGVYDEIRRLRSRVGDK